MYDVLEKARRWHQPEAQPIADDFMEVTVCDVTLRVRRCANTHLGLRCGNPGTLSSSTHAGPETKFFCWQHFGPPVVKPLPPPGGFKSMRDVLNGEFKVADDYRKASKGE
jgi:hypothetical protein